MNTYTAEQPEKEQEVIPTVTSIDVPNPEGDKMTSLDHADVQLDSKSRGIHTEVFFFPLSQLNLTWRLRSSQVGWRRYIIQSGFTLLANNCYIITT